jgi:tetratricopeptide (TPR) repeat protein
VHSHTFPGGALRRLAALDWTCGRWAAVLHQWPHILDWATGPWGVWVYRLLGRLNNDLGQPETARQELQRTLAQVESWGELQITVPHLEQLARAYALLGRESETAQTVQQFLEAIDRNPYVDWGCTMPVLFACHWYAGRPGMEAEAHACLGRLERADRQLRTPETQAARAEGWASVTAAQGHLLDAANASQSAATTWGTLGRPYDQARALSAVGRTLAETGDSSAAYAALEQALRILDSLAAQLDDPELKHGFLYSALVREVRQAIRPFTDPESIRLR